MENLNDKNDVNQNQLKEYNSKYKTIISILFLVGLTMSFFTVIKGPYESLIGDYLEWKGYNVGMFPPVALIFSVGLMSSKKPLFGLLLHSFFLLTVWSDLFYNYGGLLTSTRQIVFIPFVLYIGSIIGIFVILILDLIELIKWKANQ